MESLVLLTGDSGTDRLARHLEVGIESGLLFWHPVARLRDLWPRWRELEASRNPLGLVVLAHLASRRSRGRMDNRYNWKRRLTRRMLLAGHDSATLEHLYRFVDWLLQLPSDLAGRYREDRVRMEEDIVGRRYVTQTQELIRAECLVEGRAECLVEGRVEGRVEGLPEGLAAFLDARFGEDAQALSNLVQAIRDPDRLQRLAGLVARGATLEEVTAQLQLPAAEGDSRRQMSM